MATCNICGGEIEFRYMGGRPTPIHVNGGWCSGSSRGGSGSGAITKPFRSTASYVNPNANCPVCGERVYFYQSPYGGRVFFDDLGWPWPKHPCTDNPRSQSGNVKTLAQNVRTSFRNRDGEPLDIYGLSSLKEKGSHVHMGFRRINENRSFKTDVTIGLLRTLDIKVADIKAAPSFVVRTYADHRILEFISVRKKMIDRLRVPRPKPTT